MTELFESLELSDEEVDATLEKIKEKYGYDLTGYSRASLKRRLSRLILKNDHKNLAELEEKILSSDEYFEFALKEITVNVTEMFRDPEFFKVIREKILPELSSYPHIKIWHPACSTGQEIYSMAILLKEERLLHKSLLFGTDINQDALKDAKKGFFPLKEMKSYTQNYHKSGGQGEFSQHYTAAYDYAMYDESLKEKMVFSAHNLVSDQSFNEFNLIMCRNVLIYFNKQLQNRVFGLLYESLCHFGYLALGTKESLKFSDYEDKFEEVDRKNKIYRKIK